MRVPHLDRIVETFIRIGHRNNSAWDKYDGILRDTVDPLVTKLRQDQLIGWFSFLRHDRETGGIPVPADDLNIYVHLRLERLPGISYELVRDCLPECCLMTRHMKPVGERSLGCADATALQAPEVAIGWALFGASSEWMLDFIRSHRPERSIPRNNRLQFLHFIVNQFSLQDADAFCQTPSNPKSIYGKDPQGN